MDVYEDAFLNKLGNVDLPGVFFEEILGAGYVFIPIEHQKLFGGGYGNFVSRRIRGGAEVRKEK